MIASSVVCARACVCVRLFLSICACSVCVSWCFCVVIIVIAEEVTIGTLSSAYFSCFIDGRLYKYIVRFLLLDETCQPQHFVATHVGACTCLTRLSPMICIFSEPKPTRHGHGRAAFPIPLQILSFIPNSGPSMPYF